MKTFKDYLKIINESDSSYVYRIDNDKISDFKQNLKTYHHSSDWSSSGTYGIESDVPEGYAESKGLFAGKIKDIAPYVSPRGTAFIIYKNKNKKVVVFNSQDENKIKNHRPFLSKFDKKEFKKLSSSNEYFSKNPGYPISQEEINNPINFIEDQGYIVNFVDDLYEKIKYLKKKNINFDYEGLNI